MPSVLSTLRDQLYGREWSFPYNCYEVGHAWTPYCSGAAVDVGAAGFKNVLPLYTSLYLFTQLGLQRKYSLESFTETFKSVLTSASFIGFNLFSGIAISCFLRNNSDRYYYRVQCYMPGLIASYLALLIERPSRRPALAFYMANMSSELLFKWFVGSGHIKPLPHGETLLFALGMACWLRFVRIHGFSHDPVSTALKYLLGPLEAKSRASSKSIETASKSSSSNNNKLSHHNSAMPQDGEQYSEHDENNRLVAASDSNESHASASVSKKRRRVSRWTPAALIALDENVNSTLNNFFTCYHVCPHEGTSCVNYTLTPTITRFIWGYTGRSLLNLAAQFRLLRKSPGQALSQSFGSTTSLNFGFFLGGLVGISRATHCLLRRASGKQEVWHSTVAGALSGSSMIFAPRSTLSIYVIWKCIEQYFFLAVQSGQIKHGNQFIGVIYAVSVNILLYVFALQPNFIRPSYMKFIDNISDHRLHQLNRMVLDIFHPKASLGYEDWFPDLDPRHMSREFQELIFNWLIQPS